MYGITETTVHSSYHRVRESDIDLTRSLIGEMLDGFETRLLPLEGNEADGPAEGETGELLLAGPQVASGYLARPETTAERFVEIEGTRFYRTGDIVTRMAEGGFAYRGRVDDQLAINGHRVETGEIEVTLRRGGDARDLAIVVEDTDAGPLLVCFFAARGARGERADEESVTRTRRGLRRAANEGLPVYMRPNKYVPVAAIDRTANGKVDRRALRERLTA